MKSLWKKNIRYTLSMWNWSQSISKKKNYDFIYKNIYKKDFNFVQMDSDFTLDWIIKLMILLYIKKYFCNELKGVLYQRGTQR